MVDINIPGFMGEQELLQLETWAKEVPANGVIVEVGVIDGVTVTEGVTVTVTDGVIDGVTVTDGVTVDVGVIEGVTVTVGVIVEVGVIVTVGVTVTVAVVGKDDEFTAINGGIDPDPAAVSPMLGLSLVQLNVVDATVPAKFTEEVAELLQTT